MSLSGAKRCLVITVAAAVFDAANACTAIGVGRDASASGYPMITHTEDSGPAANDVRLARVPRKRWPKGSKRPLYNVNSTYPRLVDSSRSPDYAPVAGESESTPLGYIPQIEETYAYWDTDYAVQNEMGVSIGESTCTAKTVGWPSDKPYGYNKAGIETLTKLALERCETAKCAVQTMGDIAVEYGFYSADSGPPEKPAYSGSAECLLVGDATPGEVWVFNILTGKKNASAIWAAQRIPPNHITAIGNAFTIRKLNRSDHDNFLFSPSVSTLAEEMGWWKPSEEAAPELFDFFKAYAYEPQLDGSLSQTMKDKMDNLLGFYSGRRVWRIFSKLSPEEGALFNPNLPQLPSTPFEHLFKTSVPAPRHFVTLAMVQNLQRDHYEGTPYDLTQGMAAGPYGNPNRGATLPDQPGQWERAISMYRTSWSFVLEAKPSKRSITWFGWDAPHGTAYVPFYAAATESAPDCYHYHGTMAKFDTKMAWWAFNLVNQYQDLNFQLINKEVLATAHEIEADARENLIKWEMEADSMDEHKALAYLTTQSNLFAQATVDKWWELAWRLIAKYRGFLIVHNSSVGGEDAHGQLYPEWWLRSPEVGYMSWKSSGPYHGVLQSIASSASEMALASATGLWPSQIPVVLTSLLAMGAIGAISHRAAWLAGRRQGQLEASMDTHYVAQP